MQRSYNFHRLLFLCKSCSTAARHIASLHARRADHIPLIFDDPKSTCSFSARCNPQHGSSPLEAFERLLKLCMPSGPQKSLQGKAACALSFLLVRAETNVPNMVSVILRSSDGADHEVSELVASASKTIRSLLEDLEVKEDLKEALIVPLPNVCDRTLRKVLVYCTHHTNCGEAETPDIDKEIQSWDVKYMSISTDELFHLVMAAHYLNIPGLLDLCCDAVADHIRDKSPQQLRECFGLKSNFLPEEEREIRRVNAWALACEK